MKGGIGRLVVGKLVIGKFDRLVSAKYSRKGRPHDDIPIAVTNAQRHVALFIEQEGAICTHTGIPYPYGHSMTVGIIYILIQCQRNYLFQWHSLSFGKSGVKGFFTERCLCGGNRAVIYGVHNRLHFCFNEFQ